MIEVLKGGTDMYIENEQLSSKQSFRMGILENITLGIALVPYITLRTSGRAHFFALLLGLVMAGLYAFLMYAFSGAFDKGYVEEINDRLPFLGKIYDLVYAFRFCVRGSVVVLFFGSIIKKFMLPDYSIYVIGIVFLLVCLYGAKGDIVARGRLMSFVFWWMLAPLIIAVVFLVTSMNMGEFFKGAYATGKAFTWNIDGVLRGGYLVMVLLSTLEMTLLSVRQKREGRGYEMLRLNVWIQIAIVFAYVFLIGVLGSAWLSRDATAGFNVMQAAKLPKGTIERLDYPILAFWIIGVFAVVSGYIFHTRLFLQRLFSRGKKECSIWVYALVGVLNIAVLLLWKIGEVREVMLNYLIYIDAVVSLLLPLFAIAVCKIKKCHIIRVKKAVKYMIIFLAAVILTGCGGTSIEDKDYVREVYVTPEEEGYNFNFLIVDLAEYTGDVGASIKTREYSVRAHDFEEALAAYENSEERELDVGHINKLYFPSGDMQELVRELADMPSVSMGVTVQINNKSTTLLELLKSGDTQV